MSLYLQGEIWWYEFYVDGKRFRSSTRTTDKAAAQRVESEHRESLKRNGVKVSPTLHAVKVEEAAVRRAKIWEGIETQTHPPKSSLGRTSVALTPRTPLQQAGEFFLARQRERCRRATVESNIGHVRRLVEFFGNIPLSQFTAAHFDHYQRARSATCGASGINHELNTLSRILKRADLWYEIKKNYTPLKQTEWKPPKIFTEAEQERIFRALKNSPHLQMADIVFTITRNTTASGCELRGLRLQHLELEADPPRIHIPPDSTKNNIRPRTIPLNEDALNACKRAVARAKEMGSHYPEDYLFPLRIDRATWDPKRPASKSWVRKQVTHLREITGIDHITPHTFRHLAVTELLEHGAPEQTVIALAGWVGRRMMETYSHTRMESKADAVKLLTSGGHTTTPPPKPKAAKAPEPPLRPAQPAQRQVTDMSDPSIQAEIDRRVAMALESRFGTLREPETPVRRKRLMRRRRMIGGTRGRQNAGVCPSTPNLITFSPPRLA
jgi:integrase